MTAPCDPPGPARGEFSYAEDGGWTFSGALTFDNAAAVLEQCRAMPLPRNGRVDAGGLGLADSSALAVLLAIKRRGGAEHRKLHVVNLPPALASLARVYGIDDVVAG